MFRKNKISFWGRSEWKYMKKIFFVLGIILSVILCTFAAAVYNGLMWVLDNWRNLRMDEVVFTMTTSLEGTNPAMIQGAVERIVPATMIVLLIVIVAYAFILRNKKPWRIFMGLTYGISILVIGISVGYIWKEWDMTEYLANQDTYSSFIDENYVDPDEVILTFPEEKRNLIYIFVESMETTFSNQENGGGKKENIIPELTEIALENETFAGEEEIINGSYALTGSTYTMGGLFAQTSGAPLIVSNEVLANSEGFLSGLTTLGDVLEAEGYQNAFCIGTIASFGERESYFIDHGDFEIFDYDYSKEEGEIPENYSRSWWGYDDYTLFDNAKSHLTEMAANDQPFNFTMLTVDTHAEDGYICELCGDTYGEDQYSNAIACESAQIDEFLRWIQEQEFYENTTIVISGDHLSMDSDYCDDIAEEYERKVYTAYINSAKEPESNKKRMYSSMDNFPTTLAALGVDIEGERLGLGTNLFSTVDTLTEVYDKDKLNTELAQRSEMLESAVGEKIEKNFEVHPYDSITRTVTVSLEKEQYDGDIGRVVFYIRKEEEGEVKTVYGAEEDNGAYTCTIPLDNYEDVNGVYSIDACIVLPDGLERYYWTENLVVENATKDVAINLSSTLYDYNAKTLLINIDNVVSDVEVSDLKCAVWEKEDQSDICWYNATASKDGTYEFLIDSIGEDAGQRLCNIHIYACDANENMLLAKAMKTIIGQ